MAKKNAAKGGLIEKFQSEAATVPTSSILTALVMPDITMVEVIYIIVFAVLCFSAAILLKRLKISREKNGDAGKYLFDVKMFMENSNPKTIVKDKNYDKLILTEFPNFLKFSKKLFGKKMGDDDGKDN